MDDLAAFEKADGFSKAPAHPLSQMRKVVDDFFSKSQSVKLGEIWDQMQSSPFGLMPSHIGIALFGFLLRDYAHGYYWSDGVNSFALNPDKLAELINAVLKQKRGADEYEIRKMAPEHEQLCNLMRDLLGLPPEKTRYPEEAKKAVRNYFTNLGYPVWALSWTPESQDQTYSIVKPALEKLEQWLNTPDEDLSAASQNFIKDLVTAFAGASLPRFAMDKEHLEQGMRFFINQKEPALLTSAEHLGLQLQDIMPMLREMMNEEVWLWKAHQVESRLPEIRSEFELVDAMNQLCGVKKREAKDALRYFRTKWISGKTKLPPGVHVEAAEEETGSILNQVCELAADKAKEFQRCLKLSAKIKEKKEEIRKAVSNPELALICWVRNHIQAEITDEEAQDILRGLPDLSQQNSTLDLERHIKDQINAMARRKLARQVKERWKAITGSDSPEAWSEQHKIPISWVQEGPVFVFLFAVINRAEERVESKLQRALELMERHNNDLCILSNEELANERFLSTAAGEYRPLIQDPSDVSSFKNHLYQKLKGPVMNWPMKLTELREAVKEWVGGFYRARAYQRVLQAIENMPETDVKEFLKNLAADPLVGSLLVQKSSQAKGRS